MTIDFKSSHNYIFAGSRAIKLAKILLVDDARDNALTLEMTENANRQYIKFQRQARKTAVQVFAELQRHELFEVLIKIFEYAHIEEMGSIYSVDWEVSGLRIVCKAITHSNQILIDQIYEVSDPNGPDDGDSIIIRFRHPVQLEFEFDFEIDFEDDTLMQEEIFVCSNYAQDLTHDSAKGLVNWRFKVNRAKPFKEIKLPIADQQKKIRPLKTNHDSQGVVVSVVLKNTHSGRFLGIRPLNSEPK